MGIKKNQSKKRNEKKSKSFVKEVSETPDEDHITLYPISKEMLDQESSEQINLRMKNALEFAFFSLEREEKREQNLVNKAGMLLGIVSTVFTLLLMATPVLMEHSYIPDYMLSYFYKTFFVLVTPAIVCILLAFFIGTGSMENGKKFFQEIEKNKKDYICQSHYDNKKIDLLNKAQTVKKYCNGIRFFLLCISLFLLVLAVSMSLPTMEKSSEEGFAADREVSAIDGTLGDYVYPNLIDAKFRLNECSYHLKSKDKVFDPTNFYDIGFIEQYVKDGKDTAQFIRRSFGLALAHLEMAREQIDRATSLFRYSRNLTPKSRRKIEKELYDCEKRYADLKILSLGIGVRLEKYPVEKTESEDQNE